MQLNHVEVEHLGTIYKVFEFSHADLEIAQNYIKKNEIKDEIEAGFVMVARATKLKNGRSAFKMAEYKEAKKKFSLNLMGKLSAAFVELNDFTDKAAAIEGN